MQGTLFSKPKPATRWQFSRQTGVGVILFVALMAFEVFNFDTTRYALNNLLGGVTFMTLGWATILAVAFCAIDFAGLAHLFTPQRGWEEPKEIWFLTGAWLLGATMNAIMTWWAVSLTILNHPFIGNEVLNRGQLLTIAPIFVAVLVWLTRLLFIGAVSIAGEHLFRSAQQRLPARSQSRPQRNRTRTPAKPKPKAKPAPYAPTKNRRNATYGNRTNYGYRQPVPMSAKPQSRYQD